MRIISACILPREFGIIICCLLEGWQSVLLNCTLLTPFVLLCSTQRFVWRGNIRNCGGSFCLPACGGSCRHVAPKEEVIQAGEMRFKNKATFMVICWSCQSFKLLTISCRAKEAMHGHPSFAPIEQSVLVSIKPGVRVVRALKRFSGSGRPTDLWLSDSSRSEKEKIRSVLQTCCQQHSQSDLNSGRKWM